MTKEQIKSNHLAVTIFVKGFMDSEAILFLKSKLSNNYETNKITIITNSNDNKIAITNLLTNETTVV